jgi:hypothetical protein
MQFNVIEVDTRLHHPVRGLQSVKPRVTVTSWHNTKKLTGPTKMHIIRQKCVSSMNTGLKINHKMNQKCVPCMNSSF